MFFTGKPGHVVDCTVDIYAFGMCALEVILLMLIIRCCHVLVVWACVNWHNAYGGLKWFCLITQLTAQAP